MAPESTNLVVDGSVAVKWLLPEEDSKEALGIRDAHVRGKVTLYAPDLLLYEVANVLRYRHDVADADIVSGVEALFLLDIAFLSPSSRSVARAVVTARRFDITFHDAVYLEIAEDIGASLVTADYELYHKTRKTRMVVPLRDYDAR